MSFETYETKQDALQRASLYLHYARQVYAAGTAMQQLKADYQGGADPALVAAVNALFSAGERSELNTMQTPLDALLIDWTTNHADALGL